MKHVAAYLVWVLAAEDFAVCLAYVYNRDFRMALYWFAAGLICVAVPK